MSISNEEKYSQAVSLFLDATVKYFGLNETKTPAANREAGLKALKIIKEILARTEQLLKIKLKFAAISVDEAALEKIVGKPLKEVDEADLSRLREIYLQKCKY